MPDLFISYSTQDKPFADFLYNHLIAEGLNVFQASLSLKPGQKWNNEILKNLKNSTCVIFLASRAACQSPYVQQEVGASVISGKNLIPIVWDMPMRHLPGWANQYQAVNISGMTIDQIKFQFSKIANKIKLDNLTGQMIIALCIAGVAYFGLKK